MAFRPSTSGKLAADDFYLVRRPEQALSPEAEAFRAWLLETAEGEP